jgi:hypothetical protein
LNTNTAATLYNVYNVAGTTHYQRTPLVACKWENRKSANVLKSGLLEADSVAVYIPLSIAVNYLKPKAWQALTTKTGKWTLQVGDFLVKGLVLDEISASFTLTALKAKYDDVVKITSVDTMDVGSRSMRHFQCGAS